MRDKSGKRLSDNRFRADHILCDVFGFTVMYCVRMLFLTVSFYGISGFAQDFYMFPAISRRIFLEKKKAYIQEFIVSPDRRGTGERIRFEAEQKCLACLYVAGIGPKVS